MRLITLIFIIFIVCTLSTGISCENKPSSPSLDEFEIRVQDIPKVFAHLKAQGKDETFTVFVFSPGGGPFNPQEAVNIQFYVEDGHIGFDWVLLGPLNIRDKEKYERLAGSLGY